MIKKFYRFGIERKIIRMFIIKEMYCVSVQLQTESFQEQDVVTHYVFVGEIKFVNNYGINKIVTQQVI